jgi:putative transposase
MLSVRSLFKKLDIFERNKVPLDLKVLGLAFYVQLCSLRRAARALSEVHRVSKTAVWKWVRKLSGKISIEPPRIPRRLVALDETCVKVNGLEYWVYAAIDVDKNEVLSMRVFPSRNVLATKLFIEEVLKHCDGTPTFAVDSAPWLTGVLKELGLKYNVESLRR